MSGIGFWELIILFMIGLIVLGPERLPRVANQLGNWLGQARRMTRVMKRQLEDELNLEKHLDILPPDRTRHTPPGAYASPVDTVGERDKDDSYSPAHAADDIGTGVGDGEPPSGGETADDAGEPVPDSDDELPAGDSRKQESA